MGLRLLGILLGLFMLCGAVFASVIPLSDVDVFSGRVNGQDYDRIFLLEPYGHYYVNGTFSTQIGIEGDESVLIYGRGSVINFWPAIADLPDSDPYPNS